MERICRKCGASNSTVDFIPNANMCRPCEKERLRIRDQQRSKKVVATQSKEHSMQNLVALKEGEPRVSTISIAEYVQNTHKSVIQLVREHKATIEKFGFLAFEMAENRGTQGAPTEFAWLNEQQVTLVLTFMRNSDRVKECKVRIVSEFFEYKKLATGALTAAVHTPPALLSPEENTILKFKRIGELLEAPKHLVYVEAVKAVKAEHGVDLMSLVAASAVNDDIPEVDVFLEPTELGEPYSLSGREVNDILVQEGLQVRIAQGQYMPTAAAGANSQRHQWNRAGKTGYNLKWRRDFCKPFLMQAVSA